MACPVKQKLETFKQVTIRYYTIRKLQNVLYEQFYFWCCFTVGYAVKYALFVQLSPEHSDTLKEVENCIRKYWTMHSHGFAMNYYELCFC